MGEIPVEASYNRCGATMDLYASQSGMERGEEIALFGEKGRSLFSEDIQIGGAK